MTCVKLLQQTIYIIFFVLFADEEVDAIVNAIKSKSKAVIELGKKFFYTHLEKDIYSAYK